MSRTLKPTVSWDPRARLAKFQKFTAVKPPEPGSVSVECLSNGMSEDEKAGMVVVRASVRESGCRQRKVNRSFARPNARTAYDMESSLSPKPKTPRKAGDLQTSVQKFIANLETS